MKRFEKGLIFLVALLACGNLALWLATRVPSFHICAFRVAQIEYHTYRRAGPDTTEIPTEWNRRYRVIEDRADIRAICRLLREMELREYSVDGAGEAWQAWATYYTYRSCLVFRMKDGSTRELQGVMGHLVRFDGHWCYATGGGKYAGDEVQIPRDIFSRARTAEE